MKVVSLLTTPSARGGAEFAAVEMLDALRSRGHDVVMISDKLEIVRDTGVRVRGVSIGPKLSARTYLAVTAASPLYLARVIRALRAEAPYDVLVVHFKKEQLIAALLPRSLRPLLVWAEWGPIPFPLRKGLPRRAYLASARPAGAILAISQGVVRNLIEVGIPADKVTYVPNVMRTDEVAYSPAGRARVRARLGIAPDGFVVGCISRFHPKKRNDVLIDAVKLLDDPRVHLLLAGEGDTEAALRAQAADLGDRGHIVPTPGRDVGDLASAFDVSVFCPSPTEGEPRAVLLAALAGRPCLSTGAEGVADMISPDFGVITSPENDAGALADAIRGYLDDPGRCERHGAAARRWAEEKYALPVVAEKLEALLRSAGAPA